MNSLRYPDYMMYLAALGAKHKEQAMKKIPADKKNDLTVQQIHAEGANLPPFGDEALFYVLWNPMSSIPPSVRFTEYEEAKRVAESMARRHGEPFYVMRACSLSKRTPPPVATEMLK